MQGGADRGGRAMMTMPESMNDPFGVVGKGDGNSDSEGNGNGISNGDGDGNGDIYGDGDGNGNSGGD
jgi:hypothetical protein